MYNERRMGQELYHQINSDLPFSEMLFDEMKDLEWIEIICDLEILYIEYYPPQSPLIFQDIPRLEKDVEFRWEIDGELLEKLKNAEANGSYYHSDYFGNDSLALACGIDDWYRLELKLKLLRIPFGVVGYYVTVDFQPYVDSEMTEGIVDSAYLPTSTSINAIMIDLCQLHQLNSLCFIVSIEID